MKVRIGPTGQDQFGTWREARHDDLVFAVALAAWWTRQPPTPPGANRQKYMDNLANRLWPRRWKLARRPKLPAAAKLAKRRKLARNWLHCPKPVCGAWTV